MKAAKVTLKSITPYSQSKHYDVPKLEKEQAKDYEARTWRERLHYVEETNEIFIPPMALKNCLSEVAKYLGQQIPGKGKSTYTKHFEAGVMIIDPIMLGIKKDDVRGEWLFVPSDGVRGSGKRVEKCFPVIPEWKSETTVHILDDTITKEAFEKHLREAGQFIGMGRFRPRNNGYYGRFEVVKIVWSE